MKVSEIEKEVDRLKAAAKDAELLGSLQIVRRELSKRPPHPAACVSIELAGYYCEIPIDGLTKGLAVALIDQHIDTLSAALKSENIELDTEPVPA